MTPVLFVYQFAVWFRCSGGSAELFNLYFALNCRLCAGTDVETGYLSLLDYSFSFFFFLDSGY